MNFFNVVYFFHVSHRSETCSGECLENVDTVFVVILAFGIILFPLYFDELADDSQTNVSIEFLHRIVKDSPSGFIDFICYSFSALSSFDVPFIIFF
jgi:hypothetical protein